MLHHPSSQPANHPHTCAQTRSKRQFTLSAFKALRERYFVRPTVEVVKHWDTFCRKIKDKVIPKPKKMFWLHSKNIRVKFEHLKTLLKLGLTSFKEMLSLRLDFGQNHGMILRYPNLGDIFFQCIITGSQCLRAVSRANIVRLPLYPSAVCLSATLDIRRRRQKEDLCWQTLSSSSLLYGCIIVAISFKHFAPAKTKTQQSFFYTKKKPEWERELSLAFCRDSFVFAKGAKC